MQLNLHIAAVRLGGVRSEAYDISLIRRLSPMTNTYKIMLVIVIMMTIALLAAVMVMLDGTASDCSEDDDADVDAGALDDEHDDFSH